MACPLFIPTEPLGDLVTALLPLTNCTPARAGLYRLLVTDLRPTIASCYADLDAMAEDLREKENDYFMQEADALAD